MSQSRPFELEDYLAIGRRWWSLFLVCSLAGLGIGYGASLILPPRYTSETLMLVQRQRVPNNFVEPLITEELNARIASIQEQTLSRTRLQPIIERYGLFQKQASKFAIDRLINPSKLTMDGLVNRLREAISLTPLKPIISSRDETIPGFSLAVTLDDPRTAQQVCADVASMFVEEDIRQRERSALGTTTFLQSQLDDAKRKLDEQDSRLAAFKRQNMGMLPEDTQTNLAILSTLNTQLQTITQSLNQAEQSKAYTESLLTQQVQEWETMRALTKEIKTGYAIGPAVAPEPNPLEKHLEELENRLSTLQAQYSDRYPEIPKVKAEIEIAKKKLMAAAPPSKEKAPANPPDKNIESSYAPEPVQIQQLRSQVHSYDAAIELGQHEQAQQEQLIKEYQSRLELSPSVEEGYKGITRDYETALQFYNDLLKKRDQSGMATDLERRQEGEQLRVMDPASLPDEPSFPKKPLFAGGGSALGLALGLALALGFEKGRKRIRTERDVAYYLGAPPFALIPLIEIVGNGRHMRDQGIGTNREEKRELPRETISQ